MNYNYNLNELSDFHKIPETPVIYSANLQFVQCGDAVLAHVAQSNGTRFAMCALAVHREASKTCAPRNVDYYAH
jgi:hypothetical protein